VQITVIRFIRGKVLAFLGNQQQITPQLFPEFNFNIALCCWLYCRCSGLRATLWPESTSKNMQIKDRDFQMRQSGLLQAAHAYGWRQVLWISYHQKED
jgi:hypothetical protein